MNSKNKLKESKECGASRFLPHPAPHQQLVTCINCLVASSGWKTTLVSVILTLKKNTLWHFKPKKEH